MKIEQGVQPIEPINPTHNHTPSEQESKKSAQKSGTEEETPNDFDARLKRAQDELEKSGESGWVG